MTQIWMEQTPASKATRSIIALVDVSPYMEPMEFMSRWAKYSHYAHLFSHSHVYVQDNVAYDTRGHCFFLEDGGEKRTVFHHNLGLGTRKGGLVPSDKKPATFWITSPLTEMTDNAAAGSDYLSGFGIWYLFPEEPVGDSQGKNFFKKKEAKQTPIDLFKVWTSPVHKYSPFQRINFVQQNNVAHSNGHIGLALFRRLGTDHGILGCSTYNPLVEPTKKPKNTDLSPAVFYDFTGMFILFECSPHSSHKQQKLSLFSGYKNRHANAHFRSTTIEIYGYKSSDSPKGVTFVRNMKSGYQLLKGATFIGNSPNKGAGGKVKVTREPLHKCSHDKSLTNTTVNQVINEAGKKVWQNVDRSYPGTDASMTPVGVHIDAEGPLHLKNINFLDFSPNEFTGEKPCNIKFANNYRFMMGAVSSVEG